MSEQMIPFDGAALPAHLRVEKPEAADLSGGVSAGFPIISIKGKRWAVTRGKEKQVLLNEDGDPRASIEAVILKGNKFLSKVYYKDGYKEGSTEKPTCYSNDAGKPAADAAVPQSTSCATCKHNQWGSRIGDAGQKGKACSDTRRLAIAPLNQLNDPMLLRVPAASLKPLMEYNELIIKRGTSYNRVVTKLGFDMDAAAPKLTFKPIGFVTAAQAAQIEEIAASDIVTKILGEGFGMEVADTVETAVAPAQEPPPPPKKQKPIVLEDDHELGAAIANLLGE